MSFGWVAVGSVALGAAAAIYASEQSRKASNTAADLAAQSQREALATEWEMYQQAREDFRPWRETGERALTTLEGAIAEPSKYFKPEEQPGYEFGFKNLIQKPYLSGQSAIGKRLSGETLKGLTRYASDYAETAYDNFLDRYYRLAGFGANAAGQQAQASTQFGSQIANIQENIGSIQSQNALNQGQIASGTGTAIAGIGQNVAQNYMNYLVMKKMGVI